MRITIERLRTLVLATGALLVAALVGFLALGKWKNHLLLHELPKRLGADIKQEANQIVYTQSRNGHTLFKIRASKEIQLKKSGRVKLQGVQIELYGEDGSQVDRISGNEFEYDQKVGRATATGPVEIAISRPANLLKGSNAGAKKNTPLANMAQTAAAGQIDVKTNGLVFDQKTGVASTDQRVEFSTVQASGSSMGATFDSGSGVLVLDRTVELNVRRGASQVVLHAQHAEFERSAMLCRMRQADAAFAGSKVNAGQAKVTFREDGSVARLDARDGFALQSATGSQVNAPTGWLQLSDKSEPQRGHLEGGVQATSEAPGRVMRGSAPVADLSFANGGELRQAHLEGGVLLHMQQEANGSSSTRDWRSPVVDTDFRRAENGKTAIAMLKGTGGVVVTGQAQQRDGKSLPSRLSADTVTGDFGPTQQLTQLVGVGHAVLDETLKTGVRQKAAADRLEATLGARAGGAHDAKANNAAVPGAEIESLNLDGNVTFSQQAAGGTGDALRGTAQHAVYEGEADAVHLTGSPRMEQAGLQLSADAIDVQQKTGQAFAHRNVKATWFGQGKNGQPSVSVGGQGPAHVVADEAEMQQSTGVATFRGHARLWQQGNSIAAPTIVLNRTRQTLEARSAGAAQPVKLVLVNEGNAQKKTASVLRASAGDLIYSEAARKATLRAGAAGPVVADMGTATSSSESLEVMLPPPGNHAGSNAGAAQVERVVAFGGVLLSSGGRRGTGQQLEYSSDTGDYVLTGSASEPPRISDPVHGTVTGASLIFNSRDDSVRVEGAGRKTTTETTAPR